MGINITYSWQLPFALWIGRRRGKLPEGEPNIHLHPKYGTRRVLPIRYENLGGILVPDFGGAPADGDKGCRNACVPQLRRDFVT